MPWKSRSHESLIPPQLAGPTRSSPQEAQRNPLGLGPPHDAGNARVEGDVEHHPPLVLGVQDNSTPTSRSLRAPNEEHLDEQGGEQDLLDSWNSLLSLAALYP